MTPELKQAMERIYPLKDRSKLYTGGLSSADANAALVIAADHAALHDRTKAGRGFVESLGWETFKNASDDIWIKGNLTIYISFDSSFVQLRWMDSWITSPTVGQVRMLIRLMELQ